MLLRIKKLSYSAIGFDYYVIDNLTVRLNYLLSITGAYEFKKDMLTSKTIKLHNIHGHSFTGVVDNGLFRITDIQIDGSDYRHYNDTFNDIIKHSIGLLRMVVTMEDEEQWSIVATDGDVMEYYIEKNGEITPDGEVIYSEDEIYEDIELGLDTETD